LQNYQKTNISEVETAKAIVWFVQTLTEDANDETKSINRIFRTKQYHRGTGIRQYKVLRRGKPKRRKIVD